MELNEFRKLKHLESKSRRLLAAGRGRARSILEFSGGPLQHVETCGICADAR